MPGIIVSTEILGVTAQTETTGIIGSSEVYGFTMSSENTGVDARKQKYGVDSSGYEILALWLWGDSDPIEWGDGEEIAL